MGKWLTEYFQLHVHKPLLEKRKLSLVALLLLPFDVMSLLVH